MGTSTASLLDAEVQAEVEAELPPELMAVMIAAGSWLRRAGATVPMLPYLPALQLVLAAAAAAAAEPEQQMRHKGTMSRQLVVAVQAPDRNWQQVVGEPNRVLAILYYCYLHMH